MKKGACLALLFTTLLLAGCGPSSRISATNNTRIPVIVGLVEAKGDKRTISLTPGETGTVKAQPSSYRVSARAKADYSKELMSARDYLEDKLASLRGARFAGRAVEEWEETIEFIQKIDAKVASLAFGSDSSIRQCTLLVENEDRGGEGFCSQEAIVTSGIVEVNQSPDGTLSVKCRTETYEAKGCD